MKVTFDENSVTIQSDNLTDWTGYLSVTLYSSSAANASSIYGWLGEILIYGRALFASEIANVENYLQNKWGL